VDRSYPFRGTVSSKHADSELISPDQSQVRQGSTETTCDITNEQFIFHYSVGDVTPIYSLHHETILAQRTRDQARTRISPKEVLRLNYLDGAMDREMGWLRRVYPSWDGGRVVIWRTRVSIAQEVRLIAEVHDISGSGSFEVPVTHFRACPDENLLMNVPLNIHNDPRGYRIQHGGFSGKAIAWMTVESNVEPTLMLLEVPPLEARKTDQERERTRSWVIPSSVGLRHHGEVMDIWLDDARGRVILAMRDETLVVIEFG
jgi:hypothetical protein